MELSLLFINKIGVPGIILILIIVLLLFGGKKIPELMKGLGKGVKEFKGASNGDSDDKKNNDSDDSSSSNDSKKSEA
ncbi:twin-arginine translocase TatA/TatE family subunit [Flavobacteriales bacterium]|jgi:sec-independent protein translocase protein TatA|nr:twin-arginine translocase TatA/TatE family subunit [Flavobacteriales bacterium]